MTSSIKPRVKRYIQRFIDSTSVRIINAKLTYLRFGALLNIRNVIQSIERNKIPGIFVEAGCALGGSTIRIGLSKAKGRKLKVYDVFGMIPPPTVKDGDDVQKRYKVISTGNSKGIGGDEYYGYKEDLKSVVTQNLKSFGIDLKENNIELVQGLYEEALVLNEPVAFAHIDCDWYSSVTTCLQQIEPNLSRGGVMIIDDYFDWSGCRKAVDDYFDPEKKGNYAFIFKNGKLIIKKN